MSAVDQESAGRRGNEVGLGGVAVGEVRFLPAVLDAQRVDVLGFVELLSCQVRSLIDDYLGCACIAVDDDFFAHLGDDGLVVARD